MKSKRGRLQWRDVVMLVTGGLVIVASVGAIELIRHAQVPLPYNKAGVTIGWLPDTVKQWNGTINEMAKKYNVDANTVAIVVTLESGGWAQAQSDAGAAGLMQLTAPTAQDVAKKYLKKPVAKYDLKDPRTNIEFGTAYLAFLRKTFGEVQQGPDWNTTVELIAAGYNGGPGAANSLYKGEGLTDTQTVVYSRDAFNMWRERAAKSSPTFDRWKERGGQTLIDSAQAIMAPSSNTQSSLDIPEWGVRVHPATTMPRVSYKIDRSDDHDWAKLTFVDLPANCAGFWHLNRALAGQDIDGYGNSPEQLTALGTPVKQVGKYYFLLAHGQAGCNQTNEQANRQAALID